MKILAVIPARGGSKGIPRKNLRLLNSKPLIYYTIKVILSSKHNIDLYLSSEDDEILHTAVLFGAKVHKRDINIADDKTTLDPVIYSCYTYAKEKEKKEYDLIITIQPTSPLLKVSSLDNAIDLALKNSKIDTIIAAKDSTHLSWSKMGDKYIPNYKERVNRQYLTPIYTETGAFLITRKDTISPQNRIGKNIELYILSNGEDIDIDTYEDWNLCEYYLSKKNILFVITGNRELGLGHAYNTLLLANDILNHNIQFLVDKDSKLAYDLIASKNYPVYMQKSDNIIEDIEKLSVDVIINDRLDTDSNYIKSLKSKQYTVINFEDLGDGAKLSDLVINAIYPEDTPLPNHYFGHKYFLLRDEFIFSNKKKINSRVKNILISFGGVDPNNYTKKVLDSIYGYCIDNSITINIIFGFGYKFQETLSHFKEVNFLKDVKNISQFMCNADIVFTSAGRTTYEIASIGTPAIVLAQNEREMTHFFASAQFGFLNLGLGYNVDKSDILKHFIDLVKSKSRREYMNKLMLSVDLKSGRQRVVKLIKNLI